MDANLLLCIFRRIRWYKMVCVAMRALKDLDDAAATSLMQETRRRTSDVVHFYQMVWHSRRQGHHMRLCTPPMGSSCVLVAGSLTIRSVDRRDMVVIVATLHERMTCVDRPASFDDEQPMNSTRKSVEPI